MTSDVRQAYDANAELYASLFLDDLDRDPQSRRGLADFSARAARCAGPVVDLGCGPGNVVDHLAQQGLRTAGIDISPGQIAQARAAFPALSFAVGDLTSVPFADATLGGVVARHSLIHLAPADIDATFVEWMRVVEPGAPVFASFFGAKSADDHGTPFDHKVITAHALFPDTIARHLDSAGFTDVSIESIPIPAGGRPFDHVTMLARAPV